MYMLTCNFKYKYEITKLKKIIMKTYYLSIPLKHFKYKTLYFIAVWCWFRSCGFSITKCRWLLIYTHLFPLNEAIQFALCFYKMWFYCIRPKHVSQWNDNYSFNNIVFLLKKTCHVVSINEQNKLIFNHNWSYFNRCYTTVNEQIGADWTDWYIFKYIFTIWQSKYNRNNLKFDY